MLDLAASQYIYPNGWSYKSFGRSTNLAHGILYAVERGGTSEGSVGGLSAIRTRTDVFKKFQFNPSNISWTMQMKDVDTPEQQQEGDPTLNSRGVGAMSVSFELLFDRGQEVYRARTGNTPNQDVQNLPPPLRDQQDDVEARDRDFARLGVQIDIFDVLEVIIGTYETRYGTRKSANSMREFSRDYFDLSAAGLNVMSQPVMVQFNTDFAFWGRVANFGVRYTKFNKSLVPVMGVIEMAIDVMQVSTASTLYSPTIPPSPIDGLTSSTNPSGSNPDYVLGAAANDPSQYGAILQGLIVIANQRIREGDETPPDGSPAHIADFFRACFQRNFTTHVNQTLTEVKNAIRKAKETWTVAQWAAAVYMLDQYDITLPSQRPSGSSIGITPV